MSATKFGLNIYKRITISDFIEFKKDGKELLEIKSKFNSIII